MDNERIRHFFTRTPLHPTYPVRWIASYRVQRSHTIRMVPSDSPLPASSPYRYPQEGTLEIEVGRQTAVDYCVKITYATHTFTTCSIIQPTLSLFYYFFIIFSPPSSLPPLGYLAWSISSIGHSQCLVHVRNEQTVHDEARSVLQWILRSQSMPPLLPYLARDGSLADWLSILHETLVRLFRGLVVTNNLEYSLITVYLQ